MIPSYTLASGYQMPAIGLGTATVARDRQVEIIRLALELGYPLLDTAVSYHNHQHVAEAMRGFPRERVFITSKIPPNQCHYQDVLATCQKSLEELQTDYLDMYLIHAPAWDIPLEETYAGLAECVQRGWVRSVGVSNFAEAELGEAIRAAEANGLPLSNNQIELHPLLYDWELLDFCTAHGVLVTAYGALGSGRIFDNPTLAQVAAECGRDIAQVSLRWLIQKGCVVIPTSSSPEHLRSNLQVFDWELTPEQVARIDAIEEWVRVYSPKTWRLRQQRTPIAEREAR